MRIIDWSSDVCSSDLNGPQQIQRVPRHQPDGKSCNRGERYNSLIKDELVIPHADGGQKAECAKTLLRQEHAHDGGADRKGDDFATADPARVEQRIDRKNTRLNSSHTCATRTPSSS